jgi:hypothetical protein
LSSFFAALFSPNGATRIVIKKQIIENKDKGWSPRFISEKYSIGKNEKQVTIFAR